MSVRLNKALRELNIGLQTAVEFLEKKSELGEVRPELSFKLSDEQYNALVKQFQQDKEVRTQAEKLFQKPKKEKKEERKVAAPEKAVVPSEERSGLSQFKPIGKIDLDALNKKPAKPEPAVQTEEPAEKPVSNEEVMPNESVNEEISEPVEAAPEEQAQEPHAPVAEGADSEEEEAVNEEVEETKKGPEIFTLKSDKKAANIQQPTVLGKIWRNCRDSPSCSTEVLLYPRNM